LNTFRRRDILENDTLSEFIDPSGTYVAAFASPNPDHASSVAKLMHVKGYKPADPNNPAHRRMFPKCIEKNGYLVDIEGNIAMLYPKEYYDEYMRERNERIVKPAGTGDTYRSLITDEQGRLVPGELAARMQHAASAVGFQRAPEKTPEEIVAESIEKTVGAQPERVQQALKEKLDAESKKGSSKG